MVIRPLFADVVAPDVRLILPLNPLVEAPEDTTTFPLSETVEPVPIATEPLDVLETPEKIDTGPLNPSPA